MAWTAPRTWTAGETVTASIMNTHIRDNQLAMSTFTNYTTTWGAITTNPTLGNGTKTASYIKIGDSVQFYVSLTMGSTTTYGSAAWYFTLPVAPVTGLWVFDGGCDDASGGVYPLMGFAQTSSTQVDLRADPTTAGNAVRGVTSTVPFTWATGDRAFISGNYRSA